MLFSPETISIPMMDGSTKRTDVMTFKVTSKAGVKVSLAVHNINDGLCYITHYRTGCKISGEHTGDYKEAARGFEDMVKVGAYDLDTLHHKALSMATVNQLPEGVYA